MITLSHLVYDIKQIATSGSLPNDFDLSNETIIYWIEQTRAILIAQSFEKKDQINDSFIQYLPCIKMEEVVNSNCCDGPQDCKILRSVKKIPGTVDSYLDNMIISVKTPSGEMIPKSNPFKSMYQNNLKYSKGKRSWYIKDDYLYVINEKFLDYVDIAGLFESPSDLGNYSTCSGQSCFTVDSEYPVSMNLATQITNIVIKDKIMPFLRMPKDDIEDGKDSRVNKG